MKKVLVVVLMLMIPVMVFGVDFSYNGMFRTRTTQQTVIGDGSLVFGEPNVISWTDYRFRLFTTATMSDALKVVWGVEVNGVWGDEDQNRDEVSVMTKNLYLDFTPDMVDWMNIRLGLQGYADIFSSAIFDEDAVGIMFMPQMDSMDLSMGYFVFHDEEVSGDTDRFFTLDAAKTMDKLTLKGEAIYNISGTDDLSIFENSDTLYIGATADYDMDDMGFGAQFVYMSKSFDNEDIDINGYFAYLYGKYAVNEKLNFKLNFGYTPSKLGDDSATVFTGINPYFNPYGLELLFPGSVMDFPIEGSIINTAGVWEGLPNGFMVIALNAEYDMFYANFGMVNVVLDDDMFGDDMDKDLGMEIDLGIRTQLTDGLDFCAVYAMFMAGGFMDEVGNDPANAHELSAKIEYNF